MKKITEERFGIVMIIATLIVIISIAGQFLLHRQKTQEKSVIIEGRNVAVAFQLAF